MEVARGLEVKWGLDLMEGGEGVHSWILLEGIESNGRDDVLITSTELQRFRGFKYFGKLLMLIVGSVDLEI
jgi:hypothetical protein